jgi:hypothetical protein
MQFQTSPRQSSLGEREFVSDSHLTSASVFTTCSDRTFKREQLEHSFLHRDFRHFFRLLCILYWAPNFACWAPKFPTMVANMLTTPLYSGGPAIG